MGRVLLVDDEANMRKVLSVILADDGHTVTEASGARAAAGLLGAGTFDAIITDQKMPDGDGFSVMAASQEVDPTTPVVVLTAYATVELAVEAMRRGAFDFISKPFQPEVVRATVRRACERAELLRENEHLRREVRRLGIEDDVVGVSGAVRDLLDTVARVAPTNATVLVVGETGTGKELVARAIHRLSARAKGPFVAINCAAFPESLLESELFGHEKGAFTGADRARQGLFEAAHRGTMFLDEAGEMPASLQAKLLRVLAEGQITRVGSTATRDVDVRIIAATHRDLRQRVRDGLFREDLYYRITVVPVHVPPLRERPDDIPALVDHFLGRAVEDLKLPSKRISHRAIEKLRRYSFPGNVRELRNLIERACILAKGDEIGPEDFMLGAGDGLAGPVGAEDPVGALASSLPEQIDLRATVESLEQSLIERALASAGGVQAEAARHLSLSRSDLAYKLRKYGLAERP